MKLSQPSVYAGHFSADEFDERYPCIICGLRNEMNVQLDGDTYCVDHASVEAKEALNVIDMHRCYGGGISGELLKAARILSDYADI